MSKRLENEFRPLLEAVSFAARAHQGQLRKDGRTPYASHVFRVCFILRHVFEIDDNRALTAALLHDTFEDTTTDFDDLAEQFGDEVARWVAMLSKDSRLPEDEREKAYEDQIRKAPWQVKLCKLADIYDNLTDSATSATRQRVHDKARRYLDAMKEDLPVQARGPWKITNELLTRLAATR